MELGSAGQVGQHPLEAELPRPRSEADRPRPGRRNAARRRPARRSTRSTWPKGPSSWPRISASARPAPGCSTSSASQLDPDEVAELDAERIQGTGPPQSGRAAYDEKEIEYPVMAGLYHFTTRDAAGQKRYDRERLVAWARERFHVDLDLDDLQQQAARRNPRRCWSSTAAAPASRGRSGPGRSRSSGSTSCSTARPPTCRRPHGSERRAGVAGRLAGADDSTIELPAEELAELRPR